MAELFKSDTMQFRSVGLHQTVSERQESELVPLSCRLQVPIGSLSYVYRDRGATDFTQYICPQESQCDRELVSGTIRVG